MAGGQEGEGSNIGRLAGGVARANLETVRASQGRRCGEEVHSTGAASGMRCTTLAHEKEADSIPVALPGPSAPALGTVSRTPEDSAVTRTSLWVPRCSPRFRLRFRRHRIAPVILRTQKGTVIFSHLCIMNNSGQKEVHRHEPGLFMGQVDKGFQPDFFVPSHPRFS